jgi:hypothetical protein
MSIICPENLSTKSFGNCPEYVLALCPENVLKTVHFPDMLNCPEYVQKYIFVKFATIDDQQINGHHYYLTST